MTGPGLRQQRRRRPLTTAKKAAPTAPTTAGPSRQPGNQAQIKLLQAQSLAQAGPGLLRSAPVASAPDREKPASISVWRQQGPGIDPSDNLAGAGQQVARTGIGPIVADSWQGPVQAAGKKQKKATKAFMAGLQGNYTQADPHQKTDLLVEASFRRDNADDQDEAAPYEQLLDQESFSQGALNNIFDRQFRVAMDLDNERKQLQESLVAGGMAEAEALAQASIMAKYSAHAREYASIESLMQDISLRHGRKMATQKRLYRRQADRLTLQTLDNAVQIMATDETALAESDPRLMADIRSKGSQLTQGLLQQKEAFRQNRSASEDFDRTFDLTFAGADNEAQSDLLIEAGFRLGSEKNAGAMSGINRAIYENRIPDSAINTMLERQAQLAMALKTEWNDTQQSLLDTGMAPEEARRKSAFMVKYSTQAEEFSSVVTMIMNIGLADKKNIGQIVQGFYEENPHYAKVVGEVRANIIEGRDKHIQTTDPVLYRRTIERAEEKRQLLLKSRNPFRRAPR